MFETQHYREQSALNRERAKSTDVPGEMCEF
jgi:hypothetical protein